MLLEPAIFVKSCLTSQVAGTELLIFRQRDIQIFLNKLMGIDELASPDFVFDEISLSAANEIMNQMVHRATEAVAAYLGNTMKSSDCVLSTSDDTGSLAEAMGEDSDSTLLFLGTGEHPGRNPCQERAASKGCSGRAEDEGKGREYPKCPHGRGRPDRKRIPGKTGGIKAGQWNRRKCDPGHPL